MDRGTQNGRDKPRPPNIIVVLEDLVDKSSSSSSLGVTRGVTIRSLKFLMSLDKACAEMRSI